MIPKEWDEMASWIIRDRDSIDRGRFDGCEADTPDGFLPLDKSSFQKIRAILWMDLQEVGMTQKDVAALFGVGRSTVSQAINNLPDSIRNNRRPADRYYKRLRDVVDKNPKTIAEFAELLQRSAHTFGFEKIVFKLAGVRKGSVATLLGEARTPKHGSEDA